MNIAVIFAGGVGKRMQSRSLPKQFLMMHGKPIIIHTLEFFENNDEIDGIVVACVEEWITYLQNLLDDYKIHKVKKIIPGGSTGQLSIYNGLIAAKSITDESKNIVLIHDGVRPLITDELITENLRSVEQFGSAVTATPVKETMIVIDDNQFITDVPDRNMCRIAKAPQSFYLEEILEVHEKALKENRDNFIDSCTMMTHYGKKVHLIDGPVQNIKITTADDFYSMRAILDAQENAQIYGFEHKTEE
jgi:2-C-methyl-D-erythritol 4-phosphate cytidylyltransferase